LQAILFDLDDTLYPEREFVLSGFRAVAAWGECELGIPGNASMSELTRLYEEGIRLNTFDRWLAIHHLGSSVPVADLVRVYREHTPTLHPFPDTIRILESLRDHYRLGLLTDGYQAVQEKKIAALGIAHFFNAITYSDTLGRNGWKPNPRPFQVTMRALGVKPREAVYVGDNPIKDFLGARNAAMWSIRVRREGCEHTHVACPSPAHEPHCSIDSLEELFAALEKVEHVNAGKT
jgi:putative hydrolase of the HAD superfamily